MNTDEFFAEAKRLNLRMLGTPEETRAALDAKDAEIERLRADLAEMTADRDSWADQASQRTQDALDLVAAERERWGRRVEVLLPYGGSDGRRDWASAGAWLYPGDVLAVVRA